MDLITDQQVADLLEIAVNARLSDAVASVQADFKQQCHRTFERKERTVYPVSVGGSVIFLPEAPIHDVLEVRFGDRVIADSPEAIAKNFRWITTDGEPSAFALTYLNGAFPEGRHVVTVRFVAGYSSVTDTDAAHADGKPPLDMQRLLKNAAADEYRNGGSEMFQSYSVSGVESYTRFPNGEASPMAKLVRRYGRVA